MENKEDLKTNTGETVVTEAPKESKGGDKSRSKTSMLLISSLIPIFLIATLKAYDFSGFFGILINIYGYGFEILLGLVMGYAIYELTGVVKDRKVQNQE